MVDPNEATGATKNALDGVQKKLGMTPNLLQTIANSPAVIQGYLGFSGALANTALSAQLREQIALTVAEANQCQYCLAAHSAVGKSLGLSEDDLLDSRLGTSTDSRTAAALGFAQTLVVDRGNASDEAVQAVRDAGYDDGEITEIIAVVALNTFTNYIHHVSEVPIDFPLVEPLAVTAS
jgi:uncharacterized peroxidase-related enzyme